MGLTLSFVLLLPGAEPVFAAHSADAALMKGSLSQIAPDWSVTLGGDKPAKIGGADLIWVRRADAKLPPRPSGPYVRFSNGDVLAGPSLSLADDKVRFSPACNPIPYLTLPVASLAAIWIDQPADREQAAAIQRSLASPRNRDIVWLKNRDVLEGTVLRFDPDVLMLDVAGKSVKVERAKLAVIGFNTELARLNRPKQVYARLTLTDGSRIGLLSAHIDRQMLVGKGLYGGMFLAPLDQVAGIDVQQGRAIALSDLKPKSYEEHPYFEGSRWPYRLDRSVAGHDLRLGGAAFDQGIGMHSASRLTFPLDGQYRRFEALVGLDEVTGKQGRATVRVLVDGKPQDLGWDGDLKGSEPPRALRLNVTGARELTLTVEYGADGLDVQDHVNWADARLVR